MKITSIRLAVITACIFSIASACFALPGVTQHIPDISGEYVFYRDSSFERESYTGFVYYDESTYGVRYYAPAVTSKKQNLPEKDIQLYFTIDATQSHFEPTGERITGTVTPDDTDLVNYLHDLLYEFTARRQRAGNVTTTVTITQDFEQFGGDVLIDFNALIPIFNLQSIKNTKGNVIFTVVATGILSTGADGATDTSFTDFKGFPAKLKDKTHSFKQDKKAQKANFTYVKDEHTSQTITLDTQWTQYADNFFFLGKNALLTFDVVPSNTAVADYTAQLTRSLIRSTKNSYTDWANLSIKNVQERAVITFPVYDNASNTIMQSCKLVEKLPDGSTAFLILTVYDGAYTKNRAYFDAVLASYTVTQVQ